MIHVSADQFRRYGATGGGPNKGLRPLLIWATLICWITENNAYF